jgi:AmmeMemoRadiSam system protein A
MSQPSEASSSPLAQPGTQPEYNQEERNRLLGLARHSILAIIEGREALITSPSLHFSELRGVFTTLYLHGKLRGCVGFPTPIMPLYRAVVESARAAASDDPRFLPVRGEEARNLQISLSILSPVEPIRADEVEVGRHGLLISHLGRRGLLLPQVPVEHGWDPVTFLAQTCLKAGLPANAWQSGARIEAFTAEVFSEQEQKAARDETQAILGSSPE